VQTLADGDELEFMLLPRLPGVAERGWSPAPVSAWDEYRHRLGAQAGVDRPAGSIHVVGGLAVSRAQRA
jgi:N-acetyl-beta-hexosaminidase